MTHQPGLSNTERLIAERVADGYPHIAAFATGIAVTAVQACAELLLLEAARAGTTVYRQTMEDAAALLTGDDPTDHVVIPLPRRVVAVMAVPDGAA